MVQLDQLPQEGDRIQLSWIQEFMEHLGGKIDLIATGEDFQKEDKKNNKTGGLKIHYVTRIPFVTNWDNDEGKATEEPQEYEEGLPVTQLYGKMASKALIDNLTSMGITDTEELQKGYFTYRLRAMRMGFPRLIPVGRAD
jgi:hypothetical protein